MENRILNQTKEIYMYTLFWHCYKIGSEWDHNHQFQNAQRHEGTTSALLGLVPLRGQGGGRHEDGLVTEGGNRGACPPIVLSPVSHVMLLYCVLSCAAVPCPLSCVVLCCVLTL